MDMLSTATSDFYLSKTFHADVTRVVDGVFTLVQRGITHYKDLNGLSRDSVQERLYDTVDALWYKFLELAILQQIAWVIQESSWIPDYTQGICAL